jgi:biotin-(acetyl-CoA carboxylase) ligase
VQIALGHQVGRERLLAALLSHLEQWYERFGAHGETALQVAWEARSLMSGRRVCARTTEASWRGVVEGIDALGRLQLRQDDGTRVALVSAEVRFLD